MDCQFIHINGQLVKRFMFRDYLGYICYIDCKDGKVFCIGRKDDFEQCTSSIHPRRFREMIRSMCEDSWFNDYVVFLEAISKDEQLFKIAKEEIGEALKNKLNQVQRMTEALTKVY